jgi:hypothetical protein
MVVNLRDETIAKFKSDWRNIKMYAFLFCIFNADDQPFHFSDYQPYHQHQHQRYFNPYHQNNNNPLSDPLQSHSRDDIPDEKGYEYWKRF